MPGNIFSCAWAKFLPREWWATNMLWRCWLIVLWGSQQLKYWACFAIGIQLSNPILAPQALGTIVYPDSSCKCSSLSKYNILERFLNRNWWLLSMKISLAHQAEMNHQSLVWHCWRLTESVFGNSSPAHNRSPTCPVESCSCFLAFACCYSPHAPGCVTGLPLESVLNMKSLLPWMHYSFIKYPTVVTC